MPQEHVKKASASKGGATKAEAATPKDKKAGAGAGFEAQEAALKPKAEAATKATKAKGAGLTWPLNEPDSAMFDVLEKAFPGLDANVTGSVDEMKWSVRDPKSGSIFYVRLEVGEEFMGKLQPSTFWVDGEHAYQTSIQLDKGDDVVAKLKSLKPPTK